MVPPVLTTDLLAAAARLIDPKPREVRHGRLFRVRVTSSDGWPTAVTIHIDERRAEARPYALADLARGLRVHPEDVLSVLGEWTRADLVAHLARFTHEELRAPAYRL